MKKFTSTTFAAAAHNPRTTARLILAFVASVLVVLLALMGMSSGPDGTMAFAQDPTESPTPEPTGPSIKLINPNPSYDPGFDLPPRLPDTADPPVISDKNDGADEAYHVVAVTKDAPANAAVEAYWQSGTLNEVTVGLLTKVAGTEDTWEMFWDIPDSIANGSGTFKVRLFQPSGAGFTEVAADEVAARVSKSAATVEMSWPSNGGEIGFYKPKGGQWRGIVEGMASGDTEAVYVRYSTSLPSDDIEFVHCGNTGYLGFGDTPKSFAVQCSLAGKTLPSEVTAIAVVAASTLVSGEPEEYQQHSADAHRATGYMQTTDKMSVSLKGVDGAGTASYPSGSRRQVNPPRAATAANAPAACLKFHVRVTDHNDRPVQGANLDVHIQGPNDQVAFGDDNSTSSTSGDSFHKPPDKGSHSQEATLSCLDFTNTAPDDRGSPRGTGQGEHNVPGGPDIKHVESTAGTGLSGGSGAGFGGFRFLIYSATPGFTDVTAWVDDEPIANEADTREADTDTLDASKPSATTRAQWLPGPMSVSIIPRADSAAVGECNRYTVRARAGNAVVPDFNVDVHAEGPNNDLDFCDPGDGTTRRAPDQPEGEDEHQHEDDGESSHRSDSPDNPEVQHTEGETDGDGNFVFGITSTSTGSTQLTAWGDGEKGDDNDVQGGSEPSGTASKSWAATAADSEVRFVNPSGYGGGGDQISKMRDADERFHIVARVDLPDVVPGVDFLLGSDGAFTKIGDGVRVGDSDTWELSWDVNVPDGDYTLRAQIVGTEKREDRAVVVDNTMQTAELTRPTNASGAPFDNRETTVEGVASAGAEGVEFYYTKTAASEVRGSAQWISCGETELGTGPAPQNFTGKCALASGDTPLEVTGVAALTWTCDEILGCELERIYQTGDAHRVFGFEANPSIVLEPSETSGQAGVCKRFEARVTDGSGQGIPDANVDVHLAGPADAARFCDLDGSTQRRAPDRGSHALSPDDGDTGFHQSDGPDTVHTEGETNSGGRFIFGVTSKSKGDMQISAWVDQNDNDENDAGERTATGVMHFEGGGGGGGGGRPACTISGDSGNNTLRGTSGDDVICGFGGKDSIHGGGGNDIIRGGKGHDDLRGNAGDDKIYGGGGLDIIRGGKGHDVLRGNSQDDVIRGYTGNDKLIGGSGDDTLRAGRGRDVLRGQDGNDTLNGGPGFDRCGGGRGRDVSRNCER